MRVSRPAAYVIPIVGILAALVVAGCGNSRAPANAGGDSSGGTGTCNACHGDASSAAPPRSTTGATATTDIGVGAHRSHLTDSAIRKAIGCVECHVVPGSIDAPGHLGALPADITFGSLSQVQGATPNWDHATATCSNVYCHGATMGTAGGVNRSPLWTKVDGTQAACGTCHGAPPPSTSGHPVVTGGLTACATCHPGTVKPDGTIDVAGGLHINGTIESSAGHPPSWTNVASPNFHAYSANQGLSGCQGCHGVALDGVGGITSVACANCHDAGLPAGVASWKVNCTMCHGDKGQAASPASPLPAAPITSAQNTWGHEADATRSGAHGSHLRATHQLSLGVSCDSCHVVPPDALADGHVNGTRANVIFAGLAAQGTTPTFDGSTYTCSSTYCHGGTLGGGTDKAPAWSQTDGSARACTACHGAPPPTPHPQNSTCGTCHTGYTSSSVNAATHVDGTLDVVAQTCTGCHGTPGSANAAPPLGTKGETATTTRAVGAHQAHLAKNTWRAASIACDECHAVPASINHANGTVEMSWGALARSGGATPTWNTTALSCTNYCHGSSLNAGGILTTPVWTAGPSQAFCGMCHNIPPPAPHVVNAQCGNCHTGYTGSSVNKANHINGVVDVAALTCSSCHGSATNAAPPVGTHGETSTASRAVGAHQAHLVNTNLRTAPIACSECHAVPTSTDHKNGTVELAWGVLARNGGFVASWNGTSLTCANYCHGDARTGGGTTTTPVWTGGGSQAACGTCHGTPPNNGTHTASTACDTCHGAGYSISTVNKATHINGTLDVVGMNCTSCHGSATAPVAIQAAPPVGTKGETSASTRAVGAHQRHLVADASHNAVACNECHVVPTTTSHSSGTVDVAFGTLAKTGGVTPTWGGTTCALSYCHGNFAGGNTAYQPIWTAQTAGAATCGTCHGVPPAATTGHPQSTACGNCHAGYSNTSVNLTLHLNGVKDVAASCHSCHGSATNNAPPLGTKGETATTTRAVGAHQAHLVNTNLRAAPIDCAECHTVPTSLAHSNGVVGLAWGALATTGNTTPTWNGTALTCTNYCHGSSLGAAGSNTTPTWTSGSSQATCGTCHGVPPTTGGHTTSTACGNCHTGYTSNSVNKANHINGILDVAALTCTSCHGSATAPAAIQAAPPLGTKGETATTTRAVGAHQAHLVNTNLRSAAVACTDCHVVPSSTGHSNGTVEMAFSTLAGGASASWNGTALTCTTYCHGSTLAANGTNTTPSWTGGATQAGCGTCHGSPPGGTHTTSTACGSCHTGYTNTSVNKSLHIDGKLDVSSYHPTGWSAGNVHGSGSSGANATGLAGCKTCHGANLDGVGGTTTVSCTACHTTAGYATWATNCTFCHGVQSAAGNTAQYPPVDTRGSSAATNVSVGRHAPHMTTTKMATPACTTCHPARTTSVVTDTAHIDGNGIAEVTIATLGGVTSTYTRTSATAATCTTYCHGNFTGGVGAVAVSWVSTTAMTCTSCHGAPPATGQHPGRNSKHASVTCTNCHGTGVTATALTGTAVTNHINGTKNAGGTGSSITTWNATTGSCTPSCHSAKNW